MTEGFAFIGLSLAGAVFFALVLLPVALRSTGNLAAGFLVTVSLLPSAFSIAYNLSYSLAIGGAHSMAPALWAAFPTVITLVLRTVFSRRPQMQSSFRWKMFAVAMIVFPVLLIGGLTAAALFTWDGW